MLNPKLLPNMLQHDQIRDAVNLLFVQQPPKKEVTTTFVRDCIASYFDVNTLHISEVELRDVLRSMVGQGVVPRTMWRQAAGTLPEIRWKFVKIIAGPKTPTIQPVAKRQRRDPGEEKPFAQSKKAKRVLSSLQKEVKAS